MQERDITELQSLYPTPKTVDQRLQDDIARRRRQQAARPRRVLLNVTLGT